MTRQKQSKAPSTPVQTLLAEAERLFQTAERRHDAATFSRSADAYRRAVQLAREAGQEDEYAQACLGLGEVLQSWAEAVQTACSHLPDAQLSPAAELQARSEGAAMLDEAVHVYQQVRQPLEAKEDARINCGNALSAWAQLEQDSAKRVQLLRLALRAYASASDSSEDSAVGPSAAAACQGSLLQQPPSSRHMYGARRLQLLRLGLRACASATDSSEDSATLLNAADAHIALGEALVAAGQPQEAQDVFRQGTEAYGASCSRSESEAGDDLPGLLHNWGVGLHTWALICQDPSRALELLQEAARQLQVSLTFHRGDTDPMVALGEVLLAAADLHWGQPRPGAAAQPSGALPGASPAGAAALHEQAEQQGFQAALAVDRACTDAWLGIAESQLTLGRMAGRQGQADAAARHLHNSAQAYAAALQRPEQCGSLQERCDVRHNLACALALGARLAQAVGDTAAAQKQQQAAMEQLQHLKALGQLQLAELQQDEDLQGLDLQHLIGAAC